MVNEYPDDAVPELASRFRDPPGWLAALQRCAEIALCSAISPDNVRTIHHALVSVVLVELPHSDVRSRLLERLEGIAAQREAVLVGCGVTVH